MALLRSLVLSKLLFCSGAWPLLNASEGHLFQSPVLRFSLWDPSMRTTKGCISVAWLYERVPSMADLRETGRPKCFKAMIRRGLQLDALQQRCLAALSVLHRHLQDLNGLDLRGDQDVSLSDVTEACPVCRVAFESRVAWSTHAMRVHGYRTMAAKR